MASDKEIFGFIWKTLLGGGRTSFSTKCRRIKFLVTGGVIVGALGAIGSIAEKMGFIEPRATSQEAKVEIKAPKKVEQVQQARSEPKPQAQTQPLKSYYADLEAERKATEAVKREQPVYENSAVTSSNSAIKMPTYTSPEEKQQELKFNEGLAYFKADNGLYGFVNQSGSLVIEPKFKGAGGFYNGLAVVKTDDELWGYIDKKGNWAVRPSFCMAGRFSEGLAAVYIGGYKSGNECYGGKWGYITVTGKVAIEPQFDRAWYFSKDSKGVAKAKVEQNGKTGYINGKGQWIDTQTEQTSVSNTENVVKIPTYTPPAKEEPKSLKFNEGVAVFQANNGLYGYVNQAGNIVIEPKFKAAGGFYNGLAVVKTDDELWGYIDKQGKWAIRPSFCTAARFSEGLAGVYVGGYQSGNECYGGKWDYITVTGKMAIEPKFDRAWSFSKDSKGVAKAKVEINGNTGYINGRGEWVN